MRAAQVITITNQFGDNLALTQLNPSSTDNTKRFYEIAVPRNHMINPASVSMATQTLSTILQTTMFGPLFRATAPMSSLLHYSNGTVGSMVVNGGKIIGHAGFIKVSISDILSVNAIPLIISAFYMHTYLKKILKQFDNIAHGIEHLIEFHHDANIGKLTSVGNNIRSIIMKQHLDGTDIVSLQTDVRDADTILAEYETRLNRLIATGELTQVPNKSYFFFAADKNIENLRENLQAHELQYTFQMCLFANKLLLEGKKAEFITRLKLGEMDKALEAFESFKRSYEESFITHASERLDAIYQTVNESAEEFLDQMNYKKAKEVIQTIEADKATLQGYINEALDGSDEKLIQAYTDDTDILYLPALDGSAAKIFLESR